MASQELTDLSIALANNEPVSGDSPGAMQLADGGGMTMAPPAEMTIEPQESIDTNSLAEQADINIPDSPATGVMDGELGAMEESQKTQEDQLLKETKEKAAEAETAERESFENMITAYLEAPTTGEIRSQVYEDENVDVLKTQRNRAITELREEQTRLRRQIEAIEDAGGGLAVGAEAEIANAKRNSLRNQADMALKIMAFSGEYEAAFDRAERMVDAMMEEEERKLNAYSMMYERNKSLFDKEEQRTFELRLQDRQAAIEDERFSYKLLMDSKIDVMKMAQTNGAPANVIDAISRADSIEDLYTVAGRWGSVDLLERQIMNANLAKIRKEDQALRPTDVIEQGGRKLLIDTQTGDIIADFGELDVDTNELQQALQIEKINEIDGLISHKGFSKSVGPNAFARWTPFKVDVMSGEVKDFTGSLDFLTSNLTMDAMEDAKERGATFGSLSKDEWIILAATATKINSWKVERDDGSVYFPVKESVFIEELDKINNFAKLDAVLKGTEPSKVGVVVTDDGKYWAKNGDGSLTLIRE